MTTIVEDEVGTFLVLNQIAAERRAQTEKWGVQSHPNMSERTDEGLRVARDYFNTLAENYKDLNDSPPEGTDLDWTGILLEEVYEALAEEDPRLIRHELIQAAAVIVAWIEDIDRDGTPEPPHKAEVIQVGPRKFAVRCETCGYQVDDTIEKRAVSLAEIHNTDNQVTWSTIEESQHWVITDDFAPGHTPESLIKGGWVPHVEEALA